MVPLNQIYRDKPTYVSYPDIYKTYVEIHDISMKHFNIVVDGHTYPKGRLYDAAVLFNSDVDFKGKTVCELGARGGIFGVYLARYVEKIYISDYFQEWGKGTEYDLGDLDYWKNVWTNVCKSNNPEDVSKMIIENQDMTSLTYPDNFFDIVISTSVIEHLYYQKDNQGDILAMKEMARICKPGGTILITTDMAEQSKWVAGTHYYSVKDLFKRLIEPTGCVIRGDYDFDISNAENSSITSHLGYYPVSSVIFSLQKLPCDEKYDKYVNIGEKTNYESIVKLSE